MLAATEVAHEKDRRTLILLLLTNLSNSELVLGKLLASLLGVLVMLAAALPVFMLTALLGGVSYGQIARAMAVTLATVLVCGSLGSLLALWREKTFQALAMTVLVLVLWLAVGEIVAAGALGETSRRPAVPDAGRRPEPLAGHSRSHPPLRPSPAGAGTVGHARPPVSVAGRGAVALLLNGVAMAMVRVWNPSREAMAGGGERREETRRRGDRETGSGGSRCQPVELALHPLVSLLLVSPSPRPLATRRVWDNPVIWREMRTWAYGRKILVVRLAYLALFALAAGGLYWIARRRSVGRARPERRGCLAPLVLLSLVLVNAQAVTSLTSERDVRALDLLLVTDLTPKEIVYGKLGGVFYNTKEMVLLPMLLCVGLCGWPGR